MKAQDTVIDDFVSYRVKQVSEKGGKGNNKLSGTVTQFNCQTAEYLNKVLTVNQLCGVCGTRQWIVIYHAREASI